MRVIVVAPRQTLPANVSIEMQRLERKDGRTSIYDRLWLKQVDAGDRSLPLL